LQCELVLAQGVLQAAPLGRAFGGDSAVGCDSDAVVASRNDGTEIGGDINGARAILPQEERAKTAEKDIAELRVQKKNEGVAMPVPGEVRGASATASQGVRGASVTAPTGGVADFSVQNLQSKEVQKLQYDRAQAQSVLQAVPLSDSAQWRREFEDALVQQCMALMRRKLEDMQAEHNEALQNAEALHELHVARLQAQVTHFHDLAMSALSSDSARTLRASSVGGVAPEAGGGKPEAGGGKPKAGGGKPQAVGGKSKAGGGRPTSGGG
jgi:hypothetical protein